MDINELPKDQFAIYGSGPLDVRGIRKARDIDLIVTEKLFKELSKKYPVKKSTFAKVKIVVDNIEIFKEWQYNQDVNKLIKEADIINGIRYVQLKDVLDWKKARALPKDLRDVKLIEEYMKSRKPSDIKP